MSRNFSNEAQFAWGFSLQVTNSQPVSQWQYVIENADYSLLGDIDNNGQKISNC